MLWRGRGVPGLFGYQPLAVRRADDYVYSKGSSRPVCLLGAGIVACAAALLTTGASANTRHTSAHRLRTAFIILAAP